MALKATDFLGEVKKELQTRIALHNRAIEQLQERIVETEALIVEDTAKLAALTSEITKLDVK